MPLARTGLNDVIDQDRPENQETLSYAMTAHYAALRAALCRRGHSPAVVNDVIHDLYIKLAATPEVLRGKRSIPAFLCRCAINLASDQRRRACFEAFLFVAFDRCNAALIRESAAPDSNLKTIARLCAVCETIAQLPRHRRVVLNLYLRDRLAPEAIAKKLGISRRTVDRHLSAVFDQCITSIAD